METTKALKTYRTEVVKLQLKELAERIGVAPSVLHKWENKRVPADKCALVEDKTGVPCHVLRPDVFKAPAKQVSA
jgi:DNA-binding transcriptional regulator YdaS (Cro superfamily)